MKRNSQVFILIKSLTMSEKRYFKIFSDRHTIGKQNKYVPLFDVLDKLEQEDDAVIKNYLKDLNINSDFLSADKNYLYQLILRSLNDFHDSRTKNLELKEMLLSIEILFYKGLYHECLKLIAKAEAVAEQCENFQLMIDVLMWKKKCSGYSLGLQKAAEVNMLIDKYLILFNNLKKVTDLYYESNLLQVNYEHYSKQTVIKHFETILKQPILKTEKNSLSFSAKIFYYLIFSNYYLTIDNKEKEFEHLQKLVDMINSSDYYSVENPLDYVSIYNRLLAIKKHIPSQSESFFDDIELLNQFVNKIQIRKEIISYRVFIHTNTHELEYYLLHNNFQNALSELKTIDKQIFKNDLEIEPFHLIYFYYLQIITLIFVGDFHKALKLINKTLQDFKFENRPQVFIRIELLNVITHYELRNESLVISLAKQVLKKNKIHSILSDIEEKLLGSIVKICQKKHISLKEENALLNQVKELIAQKQSMKKNSMDILLENYSKWLSAKMKKQTVQEFVSEK